MTDIELLPLPKWLLEAFTDPTIERLTDYARAVAEHNVAARAAEIEALRAEVAWQKRVKSAHAELHREAKEHAERLAEALLELCNVIDGHEVHVAVEGKAAHARAALRDHDQEGKDG